MPRHCPGPSVPGTVFDIILTPRKFWDQGNLRRSGPHRPTLQSWERCDVDLLTGLLLTPVNSVTLSSPTSSFDELDVRLPQKTLAGVDGPCHARVPVVTVLPGAPKVTVVCPLDTVEGHWGQGHSGRLTFTPVLSKTRTGRRRCFRGGTVYSRISRITR